MPVTLTNTLINLIRAKQAQVQAAINDFENPSMSDAAVKASLGVAGQACVDAAASIPSFCCTNGQFFAQATYQAFTDGGSSLVTCTIVSPGAFSFTGIENSVGPYHLRDRLGYLIDAIVYWRTDINNEELGIVAANSPQPTGGDYAATRALLRI